MGVYLFKHDMTITETCLALSIIDISNTGANPDMQVFSDTTINYATIDNQNNQYLIRANLDANTYPSDALRFFGCRISYTT